MLNRILILCLTLTAFFWGCHSEAKDKRLTGREKIKLCHIKSRTNLQYYYTSKGFQKERTSYKINYDKEGRPIEKLTFETNTIKNKNLYSYNDKGNLIDSVEYVLVENKAGREEFVVRLRNTFKYDENSNKVEERTIYPDGTLGNPVYFKYDKNRKLIESNEGGIHTYKYNDKGQLILEYAKDSDEGDYRTTYKYNKQGFLVEEIYTEPGEDKEAKTIYEYDDNGDLLVETDYNNSGKVQFKKKYNYDENRNLLRKQTFGAMGNLIEEDKYKFDKDGNLIENIHYLEANKPFKMNQYIYEYYDK